MRKRFFLNCLLILTLVIVMSTNAFAISESDVESAVSASGKEAVSGNVLVWFLCAIAFLKVSQKIDSFLSSLGLNVGHTGGSMLSEAMIAMRAINTATSAVGSALGSRSRHGSAPASGKSGGGSAAAAGFFSGGLVGMASRKIASDAVRTATVEKNIVQPQQAEATVSRTHASSDTHSGSQSASEQQRQNTSQLDQNQQTVSSRAVNSEQREKSQQALHESQHSMDASQLHQDTQTAQEQQFHAALHTEDQQASHLSFQSEQGEFVGSVVQSDEFDASSEEARTEQSQVMQSALQQEQIGVTQREVQSEESRYAQRDTIAGFHAEQSGITQREQAQHIQQDTALEEPQSAPSDETESPPADEKPALTISTEEPSNESTPSESPSVPRNDAVLTITARTRIKSEAEATDELWHEIRNAYRTRRILTGTLDGIEQTTGGKTLATVSFRGFRIAIPIREMLVLDERMPSGRAYADYMNRLNRILGTMLGAEIDFIVKGIDSTTHSAVASRREAMLRKRQTFYLGKDVSGNPYIYPGRLVEARVIAVAEKVLRVEAFGIECAIFARDLSWQWVSDVRDLYSVGDRVLVRVQEISGEDAEHLSIRADIRSTFSETSVDIHIVIIRGNIQQDISHLVRPDKVKGIAFLQPLRKNGDHPFQLLFFLFCVGHDKFLLYVFDSSQIIAYKIFFLSCAEKVEAAPIF